MIPRDRRKKPSREKSFAFVTSPDREKKVAIPKRIIAIDRTDLLFEGSHRVPKQLFSRKSTTCRPIEVSTYRPIAIASKVRAHELIPGTFLETYFAEILPICGMVNRAGTAGRKKG